MSKSNSKNIRVFHDWFGIDNKSVMEHKKLCEFLYDKIQPNTWEWSSDKTCFWLEEKSCYYTYYVDDGLKTNREFNLPIKIEDIILDIPKNSYSGLRPGVLGIKSIVKVGIGKIYGSEAQHTYSGELDPKYLVQAQQELAENPIPQAGFDWDVVKQAVEG